MKKLSMLSIVLCTITLFAWSCKEQEANTETPEVEEEQRLYDISANEEANIQLVSGFIDALIANKGNGIKDMVSDDYIFKGPAANDSLSVDELAANWAAVDSLRSNQNAGILAMTSLVANEGDIKGDWVHVWGNYTADVNDSDFSFNVPWHQAYKVENGKITYTRTWYDRLSSALEMGTVISAPKE